MALAEPAPAPAAPLAGPADEALLAAAVREAGRLAAEWFRRAPTGWRKAPG